MSTTQVSPGGRAGLPRRRIVISGSSGLVGRALVWSLQSDEIEVTRLVRRPSERPEEVEWLRDGEPLDPEVLDGAEAVVNLNGASVGRLPWSARYREVLRASRIEPTRALATAVRALGADAPLFVSASAVGFYGSAPGEVLTESSPAGDTVLAQLCVEWEATAGEAGSQAQVALLRTAPILHREAVLKPLIRLTSLGLGGPLGRGTQLWPWISLEDEVRAIRHIIEHRISGPVNLTGPEPAAASDIGRALARRLHRPFLAPAPAPMLRALLGAAADSLLLADADARPQVLAETGFRFEHRSAAAALAAARL